MIEVRKDKVLYWLDKGIEVPFNNGRHVCKLVEDVIFYKAKSSISDYTSFGRKRSFLANWGHTLRLTIKETE